MLERLLGADDIARLGLLTQSAYAQHRKAAGLPGGSRQALHKAIETGRCPVAGYKRNRDGSRGAALIDPKVANAAWSSTSLAPVGSPSSSRPADDEDHDYNASRAKHEHEKSLIAEMKRQQMEGELRDRAEVEAEWVEIAALTKAAVLGKAPRLASAIVNRFELPDDAVSVIQSMIEAEDRTALNSLGADAA